MSKLKTYDVTLTPLEPYFFGGEKTFHKELKEDKQEYYVRSNLYPQQTALLGAIRYVLLEQNGLLPVQENKINAVDLIGTESFNITDTNVQSFGIIKFLSPVFFKKGMEWFRMLEKNNGFLLQNARGTFIQVGAGGSEKPALLLKDYDAKKGLNTQWIGNSSTILSSEDLFYETEQIGIQKHKNDRDDEEAFYKQVYIHLKDDYSFAFQIVLKENKRFVFDNPENGEQQIQFADSIIMMGGERSPFRMHIEESNQDFHEILHKADHIDAPKLILLSDALVDPMDLQICRFVLSDTLEFRQFRTSVTQTESYLSRKKEDGLKTPKRSSKFNLLAKGGVIYFNKNADLESFANKLKNHPAFQIGFNHFQTIQSN
jgi:CRISPR-associated protein Cmr3